MTTVEYIINGVETFKNTINSNYIQIGSETINATGTIINPKYLSAMVSNSVNPTNLNLVNALSVASATTSPAYTINLQSAAAGVGSLWGIDYETTTGEDLQFTTSSATAGVSFNTVGGTTTTRIKNGTIASASSANVTTITPNQVEITDTGNILKKSTFGISQWLIRNGAFAFTQFDPTEINITNGNDVSRQAFNVFSTTNNTTGYLSSMGNGVSLNLLSNVGTRISNAGINLGFNNTTSTSAITMNSVDVTNGTLTKTWTDILTPGGGGLSQTFNQVLTTGNVATNNTAIFTSGSTTLRNTLTNLGLTISDTAVVNKKTQFAIGQWDLQATATSYTQFQPNQADWINANDSTRITQLGIQGYNTTTTRSSFWGQQDASLMVNNLNGLHLTNTNIELGYGLIGATKELTITKTSITNTSPSLTKTWVSLLSIGTLLQANVGVTAITNTRLCQCSLNSGAAIPAGTYSVSYMVVFSATTTTFQTGFATPTAPIVDGTTASGTLYQYGGSNVNNTGTTGSCNVSGASVIVFSGTTGCAIGIQVTPSMNITSAYLQAVRIA